MSRLNTLLIAILVACALSLVTAQYNERRLFVELERAQADTRKLDIEWNQLQIDQTTYSKHSLIDSIARRDLQMQPVTPARTNYLTLPSAIPSANVTADTAK